jgi:hypothetical protein
MNKQDRPASNGSTRSPVSDIVIHQTGEEPVRFQGRLLGTGIVTSPGGSDVTSTRARLYRTKTGRFVWAIDRVVGPLRPDEEPTRERVERSEASVFDDSTNAWRLRPSHSEKLERATTRAWYAAVFAASEMARQLYEAVG